MPPTRMESALVSRCSMAGSLSETLGAAEDDDEGVGGAGEVLGEVLDLLLDEEPGRPWAWAPMALGTATMEASVRAAGAEGVADVGVGVGGELGGELGALLRSLWNRRFSRRRTSPADHGVDGGGGGVVDAVVRGKTA
ncbi:MAG: hypothetical protein R3B49_08495 [Phycisphaerales bacterium]